MKEKKNNLKDVLFSYEKSCYDLIFKFCEKQDLEFDYWIGGKIGEIASFCDQYYFNLSDIVLDLKTKQKKGFILKWQNDSVDYNFNEVEPKTINYNSYIMGFRYKKIDDNKIKKNK